MMSTYELILEILETLSVIIPPVFLLWTLCLKVEQKILGLYVVKRNLAYTRPAPGNDGMLISRHSDLSYRTRIS
jgi:hypothetical protein